MFVNFIKKKSDFYRFNKYKTDQIHLIEIVKNHNFIYQIRF